MKSAITLMLDWEIFENKKIILLYQIASAVLIGVCGTILLVMFLATILPLSKAVNFIPWLIGIPCRLWIGGGHCLEPYGIACCGGLKKMF